MNRSFSKIRHIQESNVLLEKRMLTEQSPTGTTNSNVAVDATKRKEIYTQDINKIKSLMPYNEKQLVEIVEYLRKEPRAVDYVDKQVYTPYANILKQINPVGYEQGLKSNWVNYRSAFPKLRGTNSADGTATGVANVVINDLINAKRYSIGLITQKSGYLAQPNTIPDPGYVPFLKEFLKSNGITV